MGKFTFVLPLALTVLSSFGGERISFGLPEGGEMFVVGQTQVFQNSAKRLFKTIKVELSRDGGNTYETLGVINNKVKNKSLRNKFAWLVQGPPSTNCIARLTGQYGKKTFSTVSRPFSIEALPLALDLVASSIINQLLSNPVFMNTVEGPIGPPGQSIQGPPGKNGKDGKDANPADIAVLLAGDSQFYIVLEQMFALDPEFVLGVVHLLSYDEDFNFLIKTLLMADPDFVAACKGEPGKDGKNGKDGLPIGSNKSIAVTLNGNHEVLTVNDENAHPGSVVLVTFVDKTGKVSGNFSIVVKDIREGAFDVVIRGSHADDVPGVDAVNYLIVNPKH